MGIRQFIRKSLRNIVSVGTAFALCIGTGAVASAESISKADSAYAVRALSDKQTMRGLTAFQLVSDMGAGWNLGNSLETNGDELYWGNPLTTKAMIDKIAEKGFTTLRIPVRWDLNYSDGNYTIKSSRLDRVEEVVNYGLDNDMYVIINIHHNDIQSKVSDDASVQAKVCDEITTVWTQIANRFKNYGDKLIFEIINEPRYEEDWTGKSSYYDCVNKYNEAGRAAIRATGGNNASRLIMLPTYCASGDAPKIEGWKNLSGDKMTAVSIHAYLPFDFAFDGEGHSNWIESDVISLKSFFARINSTFISKGIPVVIGEFGACNKNNTSHREKYAKFYIECARQFAQQNIPCVWWDNNAYSVGKENFGLFNRNNLSFTYGGIADAIVKAYEGNPPYEISSSAEKSLFSGNGVSSSWGQAVAFDDVSFILEMKSGDKIYAEYNCSSNPNFILQSFADQSRTWIQVAPDSVSNGVAVWSYETLLNKFGGTFSGLDKAYVGDTGPSLTVTKVYVPSRIPAHTHTYNGTAFVTLSPTATTDGIRKIPCSVSGCEAYKIEVIPASAEITPDVPSVPDVSKVEQFVERLYTIMLNRNSDEGKQSHVTGLLGGRTAADIAEDFVLGEELKVWNISNEEFVRRMYLTFLDREADPEGLAVWTSVLDKGCSYGRMFRDFCNSAEFKIICDSYGIKQGSFEVTEPRDINENITHYCSRMYTKALGRAYDIGGLNNWTEALINGTETPESIALTFLDGDEFRMWNHSDEVFVDRLYETLFNRPADAEGKQTWLNLLALGTSRKTAIETFVQSQEFIMLKESLGL